MNFKQLLRVLWVSIGLCFSIQSNASSIMGAYISYQSVDSVTYAVTVRVYSDCNGVALPSTDSLEVSWQGGGFTTAMALLSTKDVTGIYQGCTTQSRCTGSGTYGILEYLYKTTVNLSGSACWVTLSWTGSARLSFVSTGAASKPLYIRSELARCVFPNNSPQITYAPQFIKAVGQNAHMSPGFIDTADGDSLGFSIVAPLSGPSTQVWYSGSWSASKPLSFLGFPNSGLQSPAGFHFDSTTAQLDFRPTKVNEVSVFVIEARKHRVINGVMTVIGLTRLEQTIIIVGSPNNRAPEATIASKEPCAHSNFCFSIPKNDANVDDSTYLSWNNGIKGASMPANALFCWAPTPQDVRNWPHLATFQVRDDACDINGVSTYTIKLKVLPPIDSSFLEVDKKEVLCNQLQLKMKNPVPKEFTRYLVTDGLTATTTPDSAVFFYNNNGWQHYRINVARNNICNITRADSVQIQAPYYLQFQKTPDTTVCARDTFDITAMPVNGTLPYTSTWDTPGINTQTFKDALHKGKQYRTIVEDGIGCMKFDSINVKVVIPKTVTITTADKVCIDAPPVTLSATPSGGTWVGAGISMPGSFNPQTAATGIHPLRYTLKDSNSCNVGDTLFMQVIPVPQPQFTADLPSGAPPLTVVFTPTFIPLADYWEWYFTNESSGKTDTMVVFNPTLTRTFTDTGKYTVTLMAVLEPCTSYVTRSKYVNVSVLPSIGIAPVPAGTFKIYPNPLQAGNILIVESENITAVTITDILGREIAIQAEKTGSGKVFISMPPVAAGVYWLHLETQNATRSTHKIIITP